MKKLLLLLGFIFSLGFCLQGSTLIGDWLPLTQNAQFSKRSAAVSVTFASKIWVIAGDVIVGDDLYLNDVWSSSDGVDWLPATQNAEFGKRTYHSAVVHGDAMYVVGGMSDLYQFKDVWSSSDGVDWLPATQNAEFGARYLSGFVSLGEDLFVLGGNLQYFGYVDDVWTSSDDGVSWTRTVEHAGFYKGPIQAVVFDNSIYLVSGSEVWHSANGVDWDCDTKNAEFGSRANTVLLVYNGKMWVIAGAVSSVLSTTVYYSTDGVSWVQDKDFQGIARAFHSGVIWNNEILVIQGNNSTNFFNDVWKGTDALATATITTTYTHTPFQTRTYTVTRTPTFTATPSQTELPRLIIDWGERLSISKFSSRALFGAVEYDGKMWVIGGGVRLSGYKDAWYSSDGGVVWEAATRNAAFSSRMDFGVTVFDSKMWITGGYPPATVGDEVYYSSDGEVWTAATASAAFGNRYGTKAITYDSKMWVIGGTGGTTALTFNDVWYSTDGVTWSAATRNAAFRPRYRHQALVYDNKMWVIGGVYGTVATDDVWYSTDGVDWTCATGNAAFDDIQLFGAAVWGGRMFIAGGTGGTYTPYNYKVWSSVDGASWANDRNGYLRWGVRSSHALLEFDDDLYLIAGITSGTYKDDVWVATPVGTGSPTLTHTMTPVYTRTRTSTKTATSTFTITGTNTPINTRTFTRTITPSRTATRTITETSVVSATHTRTVINTKTSTITLTLTVTATPTVTITPTQTQETIIIYTTNLVYHGSAAVSAASGEYTITIPAEIAAYFPDGKWSVQVTRQNVPPNTLVLVTKNSGQTATVKIVDGFTQAAHDCSVIPVNFYFSVWREP